MKYFTKVIIEDTRVGKLFPNNTQLARILGVKQSYMHLVMDGSIIISDKQYNKFQQKINEYLEQQSSLEINFKKKNKKS